METEEGHEAAIIVGDPDRLSLADFFQSTQPDMMAKTRPFLTFIDALKANDTYAYRRVLASACGHRALIVDTDTGVPKEMVMMASNNYLGLTTRPEVIEGAVSALRKYGTGVCGAPLLNGTYDYLNELEQRLAEFMNKEDVVVTPTGYSANVAAISGMVRRGDLVLVDRCDHASILDGCRQSDAEFRVFRHNDVQHLKDILAKVGSKYAGLLIVVDGVYSMEGDVAHLPELVAVARYYGARLLVDEAHGVGVLGKTGAGVVEHFGLQKEIDFITGTFSKTLCSVGGFIATSRECATYIRHYARPYIFSASPSPSVAGTVLAVLDILKKEPHHQERLWDNVKYMCRGFKSLGLCLNTEPPESAIISVTVGTVAEVRHVNRFLSRAGLFVNSVEYPAAPKGGSKLRIGIMASHTKEDLDKALSIMAEAVAHFGLAGRGSRMTEQEAQSEDPAGVDGMSA